MKPEVLRGRTLKPNWDVNFDVVPPGFLQSINCPKQERLLLASYPSGGDGEQRSREDTGRKMSRSTSLYTPDIESSAMPTEA